MEISNTYRTLSDKKSIDELFIQLRKKGYNQKFRREPTGLYCIELKMWIKPDDFIVDEQYYFTEISRPDLDRIVCAITTKEGIKGMLVDTLGVYADNMSWEMIQKFGF